MTTPSRPGVAAFDFDGTITRRDTLLGFVTRVASPRSLLTTACLAGPAMVRGALDDAHRDAAKERAVGRALAGWDRAELDARGTEYAAHLTRRFRNDTLAALAHHRAEGHATVIVSASLVHYLRPVAEQLGVDDVIGVELEFDADGRATGRLAAPNVRGPEKVRRLDEWLAARFSAPVELWAYGNSSGDADLLERADHATWVS